MILIQVLNWNKVLDTKLKQEFTVHNCVLESLHYIGDVLVVVAAAAL